MRPIRIGARGSRLSRAREQLQLVMERNAKTRQVEHHAEGRLRTLTGRTGQQAAAA